jgi:hypothetical protein
MSTLVREPAHPSPDAVYSAPVNPSLGGIESVVVYIAGIIATHSDICKVCLVDLAMIILKQEAAPTVAQHKACQKRLKGVVRAIKAFGSMFKFSRPCVPNTDCMIQRPRDDMFPV